MKTERDPLAVYNERMKLLAGFFNAIGLGLIGFAVLRPVTDGTPLTLLTLFWGSVGFALHGAAHYILGRLRKEADDDRL